MRSVLKFKSMTSPFCSTLLDSRHLWLTQTASANFQTQVTFKITWITVFDPTNASIFFQSRSNLHTEWKKQRWDE